MQDILKIKVDFDGNTTKSYLNFISNTQEGKYTSQKPDLTQVTYKRLYIQEQQMIDENNEEVLLFGVSH
jgi:hypothetical protein